MTIREQVAARRAMAAATGRRLPRKLTKVPRAAAPSGIERDYYLALRAELRGLVRLAIATIEPQLPALTREASVNRPRADSLIDSLDGLMSTIRTKWGARAEPLRQIVRTMTERLSRFNFIQIERQFKQVLGVDPFAAEPWLADELAVATRENTRRINGTADQVLDRVEATVTDGVRRGESTRTIAKKLEDLTGWTDTRAKLIARDQVGKMNGKLTELRQQSHGVKEYTWRNMGDQRVRGNPGGRYPKAKPSHWHREGQRFRWDQPPEGGHPGEAHLCRCYAEPVLDLFADLM